MRTPARKRMGMLVTLLAGCAAPRPAVVAPEALAPGVDAFLASHPVAAGAGVRADVVARSVAASWHVVQSRQPEPPHRHVAHDITVALLRGGGAMHVAGRPTVEVHPGDVTVVPRGLVHWFVPDGAAVALITYAPPLDAPDTERVDVDSTAGGR